jgi:hypothetical protein
MGGGETQLVAAPLLLTKCSVDRTVRRTATIQKKPENGKIDPYVSSRSSRSPFRVCDNGSALLLITSCEKKRSTFIVLSSKKNHLLCCAEEDQRLARRGLIVYFFKDKKIRWFHLFWSSFDCIYGCKLKVVFLSFIVAFVFLSALSTETTTMTCWEVRLRRGSCQKASTTSRLEAVAELGNYGGKPKKNFMSKVSKKNYTIIIIKKIFTNSS